jgi:hypothetical protein
MVALGIALASSGTANAQSIMKVCGDEWQAAKAAGTTNGQTWQQFLKSCRAQHEGGAAPATAQPQTGSLFPWQQPAAPAPASNQSVMAACGEQWKQAKAAGTTGGTTWPQFLRQCRAQMPGSSASIAPAPAPSAAPAPPPTPANSGAPPVSGGASAQEVQYRCPGATVVWVNEHSHIYHFPGTHDYGNTKRGEYMCEADAQAAGNRAAKNERHP